MMAALVCWALDEAAGQVAHRMFCSAVASPGWAVAPDVPGIGRSPQQGRRSGGLPEASSSARGMGGSAGSGSHRI
jgi:hypothetical protein